MQYATCSNIEKIKKQQNNKSEEQRQKGRKLNKTQRGGKIREWESVQDCDLFHRITKKGLAFAGPFYL